MSSLAATQADGYYLPPEYFEGGAYKKQSKNAFDSSKNNDKKTTSSTSQQQSQHGHNQWLQRGVVRFELPYKGVCEGPSCPQPSIGRGTRYNAKKITTAEKYFSTPIYEFRMSCRKCQHPWIIRTNPKERGFDYVSGIHVQAGQEDVADSSCGGVSGDTGNGAKDALDRLESTAHGKRRALTEMEELQRLQKLNKSSLNDADHNAIVRKGFRQDRTAKRKRQQTAADLGWRRGMEILSEDTALDIVASKEVTYGKPKEEEQKRLRTLRTSSIFSSSTMKTSSRRRRKRERESFASMAPSPVRSSSSSTTTSNTETGIAIHDSGTAKTKKRVKLGGSSSGRVFLVQKVDNVDRKASSLSEMLAAYESSGEEDD